MTGKPLSSTAHTANAISYNAHHGKRPEMLQNRLPNSNAERTETTPVAGGSRALKPSASKLGTQAGRTEDASDPSASEARRHLVAAACSLTLLIVMATTETVSNYLSWSDLTQELDSRASTGGRPCDRFGLRAVLYVAGEQMYLEDGEDDADRCPGWRRMRQWDSCAW
ncbi:hypothetical protein LTR37_013982 [Vermiconidia calcicola]|uniref:Uncharacterized protein n=1 Tax=Vermiconidia calcicola TaxID=1690605 RepID=A0ACC3MUP5_9PEZI|nr:hypothetical protein LTR37_013982 [Vermiconidia calcicola]